MVLTNAAYIHSSCLFDYRTAPMMPRINLWTEPTYFPLCCVLISTCLYPLRWLFLKYPWAWSPSQLSYQCWSLERRAAPPFDECPIDFNAVGFLVKYQDAAWSLGVNPSLPSLCEDEHASVLLDALASTPEQIEWYATSPILSTGRHQRDGHSHE